MAATSPDQGPRVEMDEQALLSVVQRELDNAALWQGTKLTSSRADALNAYFGNPRGDEREGRSSVTTRDVLEQVEWALAFLVDVFESVERLVNFEPVGEEDAETSKQATDATHLVYARENGSGLLYDALKDGFIQKNGYGKVRWVKSRKATHERYEGKSLQEVVLLTSDPSFQVRAITAYVVGQDGERQEVPPESLDDPNMAILLLFDVSGVRVDQHGHVALDSVAPENLFINSSAKALDHVSCRFVAERFQTTASELIAMGVDRDLVDSLPSSSEEFASLGSNEEYRARRSQEEGLMQTSDRTDSERPVVAYDVYVLVDMDGDGISEWWNALVGGDYGQVMLMHEPAVGHPFVAWTPIPITHRIHGLSLADLVVDIQGLNTDQWRQYLNNLFLTTDPTYVVQCQGLEQTSTPLVNLNQLVKAGPGTYIEEYASGALRTLEHGAQAQNLLPSMELSGKMLQSRTGVSPETMGLDPTKISDHVFGAAMQQAAAAQRLILYARLFAKNFVVPMFKLIFRELQMHAMTKQMLRVHDQWREIDPASWTTEVDVHVSLPLGHASRGERVANLQMVAELQKALREAGLLNMVPDKNLYHTARNLIEALGFKDVHSFVLDPETAPPVETEPTPAEQALALQQEIEALRLEIDRQKQETDRFRAIVEAKEVELKHEEKIQELQLQDRKIQLDVPEFRVGQ